MGNAFSIIVGMAAIGGAICSILSTYATYAAKLNRWPFTGKPPPVLPLHEDDRYVLREIAVLLVDLKTQLKKTQVKSITNR